MNTKKLIYTFGEKIPESVKRLARNTAKKIREDWRTVKWTPTIEFGETTMIVSGEFSGLDWFECYFRKRCQSRGISYMADLRDLA